MNVSVSVFMYLENDWTGKRLVRLMHALTAPLQTWRRPRCDNDRRHTLRYLVNNKNNKEKEINKTNKKIKDLKWNLCPPLDVFKTKSYRQSDNVCMFLNGNISYALHILYRRDKTRIKKEISCMPIAYVHVDVDVRDRKEKNSMSKSWQWAKKFLHT